MSKWILQNETMKDNQIEKWEFVPDNKFVEKFPNLKDYVGDRLVEYVVVTTKKREYGSDYVSKYRYNRKENELKTE